MGHGPTINSTIIYSPWCQFLYSCRGGVVFGADLCVLIDDDSFILGVFVLLLVRLLSVVSNRVLFRGANSRNLVGADSCGLLVLARPFCVASIRGYSCALLGTGPCILRGYSCALLGTGPFRCKRGE